MLNKRRYKPNKMNGRKKPTKNLLSHSLSLSSPSTTSLQSNNSPHTQSIRHVNMYKYETKKVRKQLAKPTTPQEKHAKANKDRRQDAKNSRYKVALELYDQQLQQGVEQPELVQFDKRTPAQKRRVEIRNAMRSALETGDLKHIPLLVDFLKKMISPTQTTIESDQLHTDPKHVSQIYSDVTALQSYGLMPQTPKPQQQSQQFLTPQQQHHNYLQQQQQILLQKQQDDMDARIFGDDLAGLELYRKNKANTPTGPPGTSTQPFDSMDYSIQSNFPHQTQQLHQQEQLQQEQLDLQRQQLELQQQQQQQLSNIATPLQQDPHAYLKKKGNELSHALLSPLYPIMNATSPQQQQSIPQHNSTQPQKATPIGGFKNINKTGEGYATLQPMSHSITGDIISSISLDHEEFGSLAGSPTFRINPQNLSKTQLNTTGQGKLLNPNTKQLYQSSQKGSFNNMNDENEIENEDDIQLAREQDAQLALDGEGTLGLHDSPLQKHAHEFATDSLLPTLGFLREYQLGEENEKKRQFTPQADIDSLGDTVGGIGSLSRTEGHFASPRQHAVISGRRSRAIEIIAKTSAAVLTKKQLLAHNRKLLTEINPVLAQATKEKQDKHYIDLYSIGYQITRIHLSKDLSTCTINWSAPCLYPLPQAKDTMELERPLLDVMNATINTTDPTKQGRVELHPMNEAMRIMATSKTHMGRRADYSIGANLTREYQFTGEGYNTTQKRQFDEMKQQEIQTGGRTEVFFDDDTKVAIKKDPTGKLHVLSQGDPRLWQLRPIFKKGSYIPGTVDILPPHLRKNSQIMTEEQRQNKQRELERKMYEEQMNIRAGMKGELDPRIHGLGSMMMGNQNQNNNDTTNLDDPNQHYSTLTNEQHLYNEAPSQLFSSLGLNQSTIDTNPTIAKQTLDAMINTDLKRSNLSKTTFYRAQRLVASATQSYLSGMVPSIRWALGQALNTKYVPQLKFEFDVAYGEAKQRAKTINAVLQRQYKKQIEKVEFNDGGDVDDEYRQLDIDQQPILPYTIGTPEERQEKLDLIVEKQKLLNKGKYNDVQIIDDFVKNERIEHARNQIREYEQGSFQDFELVSPQDESMMKRVQIKDDNISKLIASATALRTGTENQLAMSTRLKHHDLTKADKILLASRYLEISESQARQLSEDRIEVVLSMLRREMGSFERKKQRQQFAAEKKSLGLSQQQLERELLSFDRQQKDAMKLDSDYEEGVNRWEAGIDDDEVRPEFSHMLISDDDDDDIEINEEIDIHRIGGSKKSTLDGKNKDGLQMGTQDEKIAAAFYKHGTDKSYGQQQSKKLTKANRKAILDVPEEDLINFRKQYLYGDTSSSSTTTTKQIQQPISKLTQNEQHLQFDSSTDNYDGPDYDEEDSNASGGDGYDDDDGDNHNGQFQQQQQQQQNQNRRNNHTNTRPMNTNSQFLEFSLSDDDDDAMMPTSKSKKAILQTPKKSMMNNNDYNQFIDPMNAFQGDKAKEKMFQEHLAGTMKPKRM